MAHHDDDASKQPRHTNRLARETSPYLLQHQHNPVDWYAWGPEAFEAARAQDKPIFLSVGYSTCYWCHVMERQCFEVEAIAAEMNRRFINIKVDREERPDVDQLYMIAVQVLTRHGGWPMSVFLTPDLRPFFGGTYFPPADAHGRPGFVTVLRGIEDAYRNRRDDVEQTAQQLVGILRELSEPEARDGGGGGGGGGGSGAVTIDDRFLARLIERSTGDYDPEHGGFGSAPKFPRETLLELLLVRQRTRPDAGQMRMLLHTLDAMANGGIRDQLGGGFHRYSTDAQWLVPHFEIMLYDNAMLGWVYAEAHAQTSDPRYARVARELFDFVLREMTSPQGGFYTALDAEVDAQEGLSYLWTSEEVEETLGADDAALFARVYGLDQGPNFADPHHGTGAPDKSILFLADPAAAEQHHERLAPMRAKLKARRDQRKQPLLDTKIITSWNALMIRALAHGARLVGDPRYLHAATAAADFLLIHHRTPTGGLFRTSRDGVKKYDAFLDDYAFLVHALVAVGDASGDARWRDEALRLAGTMIDRFGDGGGAGSASASATAVGGAEGAEGAEGA
ncbi:MAG TPA: thioredoxin domain-containing protein, partial [Tepidisphaeraceae bacterium]|nr:thioredoxin domain-containing protein [Tepidisphaeraceae bacterium]